MVRGLADRRRAGRRTLRDRRGYLAAFERTQTTAKKMVGLLSGGRD
jgi:hypothetical protein